MNNSHSGKKVQSKIIGNFSLNYCMSCDIISLIPTHKLGNMASDISDCSDYKLILCWICRLWGNSCWTPLTFLQPMFLSTRYIYMPGLYPGFPCHKSLELRLHMYWNWWNIFQQDFEIAALLPPEISFPVWSRKDYTTRLHFSPLWAVEQEWQRLCSGLQWSSLVVSSMSPADISCSASWPHLGG